MGELVDQVRTTIRDHELLAGGAHVVVGVSGGADSMALLHVLNALNHADRMGWSLHVAHLDHQIRGEESRQDADLVRSCCQGWEIPCTVAAVDIPALAAHGKGSIEEIAREQRYAFLEKVALRCGARRIAVAHHADDNAETILHRILRGTGIRGLGGIRVRRPMRPGGDAWLIRPLLACRREDVLAYVQQNEIPFRVDRTNLGTQSTRSRIRNQLLPTLAGQYNPAVADALLRLGQQARLLEDYLAQTAQRQLEALVVDRTDRQLRLNAEALVRKGRVIQMELLRQAILTFSLPEQDFRFEHVESLRRLAESAASGKELDLPGGLKARKEYGQLVLTLSGDEPVLSVGEGLPRQVSVPGRTHSPFFGIAITAAVEPMDSGAFAAFRRKKDRLSEWLDADQVKLPLILRRRRPGDRFWPLGAPGTKKISDFFIDGKVLPSQRDRVPLLCDQLGPIWIVGHRIDDRVRITAATRRVLQLRAQPT